MTIAASVGALMAQLRAGQRAEDAEVDIDNAFYALYGLSESEIQQVNSSIPCIPPGACQGTGAR